MPTKTAFGKIKITILILRRGPCLCPHCCPDNIQLTAQCSRFPSVNYHCLERQSTAASVTFCNFCFDLYLAAFFACNLSPRLDKNKSKVYPSLQLEYSRGIMSKQRLGASMHEAAFAFDIRASFPVGSHRRKGNNNKK